MARPEKLIDEHLILKRLEAGFTTRQIAKEFGICSATVSNRMKKYGNFKKKISVKSSFILK